MRVLLVLPKSSHRFKHLGDIPPLGIAYVSSALRRDGHETAIWDETTREGRVVPDFSRFDLVGISCDTIRYESGLRVARMVKARGVPVVMGGSHATFLDREALETGLVDYVVRNEGEDVARELCAALDGGGDLAKVKGITYRHEGEIVRTPDAPFPQELDLLAWPDRETLGMDNYRRNMMGQRPFTTMLGSRGCPYSCEFCSSPRLSGKTRYRDPVDIVDEMEDLVKRWKFGTVVFTDDIFTVNPKRVSAICDEILARRLDVKWWCCSRVDTVMRQQELFRKMAEAGCYTVFLGIDGGTDAVLEEFNKGYTADVAFDSIHYLQKLGIEVNAAFILGGIQETREQMLKTIAYAKALRPETVQFTINTPLPGAELWEKVQDRIEDRDWSRYDLFHAVMRLDAVKDRREVQRLLLRAYVSFYLLSPHGLRNVAKFVKERIAGPERSRSYDEPISASLAARQRKLAAATAPSVAVA
ncbi:MAG: radical SAM protein [Acidobacteriota bacterium]